MLFELLTLWGASTQVKSKPQSHSSTSHKKQDTSVKDFMKDMKERNNQKLKTEKAYEDMRKGLW